MNINVRDPGIGAVGDGVSDDYHALLRAARRVSGTRGTTLVFPPGTYGIGRYKRGGPNGNGISDIVFENRRELRIVGYGARIEVKGDFHRPCDHQDGEHRYSYSDSVTPFVFSNCRRFQIEGFELNGNVDKMSRDPGVGEGNGFGIATYDCSDYVLSNMYIHRFQTDGMYLGGGILGGRERRDPYESYGRTGTPGCLGSYRPTARGRH